MHRPPALRTDPQRCAQTPSAAHRPPALHTPDPQRCTQTPSAAHRPPALSTPDPQRCALQTPSAAHRPPALRTDPQRCTQTPSAVHSRPPALCIDPQRCAQTPSAAHSRPPVLRRPPAPRTDARVEPEQGKAELCRAAPDAAIASCGFNVSFINTRRERTHAGDVREGPHAAANNSHLSLPSFTPRRVYSSKS
ncbi:UNVERIFIED_CONTAM: hypothetical protein FKN15_033071 [Acipenser sinensis]